MDALLCITDMYSYRDDHRLSAESRISGKVFGSNHLFMSCLKVQEWISL